MCAWGSDFSSGSAIFLLNFRKWGIFFISLIDIYYYIDQGYHTRLLIFNIVYFTKCRNLLNIIGWKS
jgi:hypothetical protein